jgi:hypothetical protein
MFVILCDATHVFILGLFDLFHEVFDSWCNQKGKVANHDLQHLSYT